jgi:hypothetical protein
MVDEFNDLEAWNNGTLIGGQRSPMLKGVVSTR